MSFLLVLTIIGCGGGPYAAPYGAEVLGPEGDLSLSYDAGYAVPGDGYGALLRAAAFVHDPSDTLHGDLPLNDIKVEVTSGWTGAYLLPEAAVLVVDDYEQECDTSGATADETDPCHAWFDAEGEQYIEFGGDYTELGDFRPTYLSAPTDNRGILNFYVFVDSAPLDTNGVPVDIPVFIDIGVSSTSFNIIFN